MKLTVDIDGLNVVKKLIADLSEYTLIDNAVRIDAVCANGIEVCLPGVKEATGDVWGRLKDYISGGIAPVSIKAAAEPNAIIDIDLKPDNLVVVHVDGKTMVYKVLISTSNYWTKLIPEWPEWLYLAESHTLQVDMDMLWQTECPEWMQELKPVIHNINTDNGTLEIEFSVKS